MSQRSSKLFRPTLELLETRLTPGGVQYTAVAAGDPTGDSVVLWTRALDPAQPLTAHLTAEVSADPAFGSITGWYFAQTDPNRDHIAKFNVDRLESSSLYYYRFLTDDGQTSPVGRFKTAPDATANVPVHFGFSGDAEGRWRPYDVTANFAAQNFDFFVWLGDTIYESGSNGSAAAADPFTDPQQALADF